MKWHNINHWTKLTTYNNYIFVSTREDEKSFKYQVISNNGQSIDTWRMRFSSHKEIKDQVELFVEDIKEYINPKVR